MRFDSHNPRLLPYPNGKRFAFTVIDDTDMATLESIRPVYECLHGLGLRTTKTVWVTKPAEPIDWRETSGDTLERKAYADYVEVLQQRGFEIALHNVSSKSSTRDRVEAGLERYRQILGSYPNINVHHEKNRENLYFAFAQVGGERPPLFRTAALRRLHGLLRRNGPQTAPESFGCSGEDEASEYFWGDMCRDRIQYVRTNVFLRDLNTLKCSPLTPYACGRTPYVKYWFDSSNGQDAKTLVSILSEANIARLKQECGCSILYTHFGKGFVRETNGVRDVIPEARRALRGTAGDAAGWYVPVSGILDRLVLFQRLALLPLPAGFAIVNRSSCDVPTVTVRTIPDGHFCDLSSGEIMAADRDGYLTLPCAAAGSTTLLLRKEACHELQSWFERHGGGLRLDLQLIMQRIRTRGGIHA